MALWSRELAVLAEDPSQHPHGAYNSNSRGANAFFDLSGLLYTHDAKQKTTQAYTLTHKVKLTCL